MYDNTCGRIDDLKATLIDSVASVPERIVIAICEKIRLANEAVMRYLTPYTILA